MLFSCFGSLAPQMPQVPQVRVPLVGRTLLGRVTIIAAILVLAYLPALGSSASAQTRRPFFQVIILAEENSIHRPFVDAAKIWLAREADGDNFAIDYITNTEKIDETFLSHYQLFLQLDYPPYMWTTKATTAFQNYIEQGKGGWIGFHHAGLLGEFDGYPMWEWFSNFLGGIRYRNYIATFVSAKVKVEDTKHPVMRGIVSPFPIEREEWYTWDKSPRPNVHVLASVDENTYVPNSPLRMGDHPVVWTNKHVKARNVYIFMGHRSEHFQSKAFTTLFHNSILWAAHQ